MFSIEWAGEAFSLRLAITLLHFVWQGLVIAAVVLLSGWMLRTGSARLRYAVNVAGLFCMLACLPVTFALVDAPMAAPEPIAVERPAPTVPAAVDIPAVASTLESADTGELQATPRPDIQPVGSSDTAMQSVARISPVNTPLSDVSDTPATESTEEPASTSSQLIPVVVWSYFVGVLFMMIRLALGLCGGHRLRSGSVPCEDSRLIALVREQAHRLGLRTAPAVGVCCEVSIPVVVGIVRPMIVLPASLISGLTTDQLQALVTHELAHIRRHDLLINLLQRLIETVLFFHPAVWLVSCRISTERENIADDVVIDSGWQPARYADALVRMAELSSNLRSSRLHGELTALAATGSNASEFRRRVMRLLEKPNGPRLQLTRSGLLALLLTTATLLATPLLVPSHADEPQSKSTSDATPEDTNEGSETNQQSREEAARETFGQLVAADHWRPRQEASRKLAEMGTSGRNLLLAGTLHESGDVRRSCFETLCQRFPKDQKTIDVILRVLEQDSETNASKRMRYSGVFHLGSYGIRKGAPVLREVFQKDRDLKLTAAKSLAELGDRSVIMVLYDNLGSNRYMDRYQANIGIKALTGKDLNDFGDYDWSEGAFVSGGVEATIAGRRPEDAETKAARFTTIAAFHKWLKTEKPLLAALLDPTADENEKLLEEKIIECRVSGGGKPLADAQVTVTITQTADPEAKFADLREAKLLGTRNFTTDAEGRYRLRIGKGLPSQPGVFIGVTVSHPDFLDRSIWPVPLSDFENQKIGTDERNWLNRQMGRQAVRQTRLKAGRQIKGRVLLWDGTPAAGATVKTATKYQAYSWKFHNPDDYGFSASATTDINGRFKLETDQQATLTVSLPGHPIVLIDNLSKFIELSDVDGPLELRVSRGVRLRGRVLDDRGIPQPNVILNARRQFAWNEFDMPLSYQIRCASNENGEYEFPPLPADDFTISATARLAGDIDAAAYNAHVSGERVLDEKIETAPLDLVFVPAVQTLSDNNQLPVFDLKASPMATVTVKVEFPHATPDPDRHSDVGIAGLVDGKSWQGRYVKADETGIAVLRVPIGLTQGKVKTGLAMHRRSPDGDVELGEAVHFGTLEDDIDGITVIKPVFAKLKVKLTLPEELSRKYSRSKAWINISARHKRDGFHEQSSKRRRFGLTGSMQSGATEYRGTAIPNEPLVLTVSVKEDDESVVVHEEELTLKPGEERLVAVAIQDPKAAPEKDEDEANVIIQGAVKFLLSQQQADGSWPTGTQSSYIAGTTALAGLALLDGGVPRNDDHLRRATLYLLKAEPKMTKEVALQAMYLDRFSEPGRVICRRNIKWLIDAQIKKGHLAGAWGYQNGAGAINTGGDMANTVFAIRALCELASRDEDNPEFVPADVWQLTADLLVRAQKDDGSWGYTPRVAQSSGSMTVCILGCLKDLKTRVPDEDEVVSDAIVKAEQWLTKHWRVNSVPGGGKGWHYFQLAWLPYALGDAERVGEHDWRAEVVEFLKKQQREDGSFQSVSPAWSPVYASAYAIQTLSKPVDDDSRAEE